MIVLDASALLALMFGEPGQESVAAAIEDSCMSAINLAETLGGAAVDITAELMALPIEWIAFDADQAHAAAALDRHTRRLGLSLGDRACLALAVTRNLPVYTADRVWIDLGLNIDIRLIR